MSQPVLRPYQHDSVRLIRERIKEKPVLSLSVGGGKTVIFSEVARLMLAKGGGSLIVVHRDELVRQAASKLRATGIEPGIIKAGYIEDRSRPVQVGSVQSLVRRKPVNARMVIIDEAHHAVSPSYQTVLSHYPDAYVWGCTSTPYRLDGRGLGSTFGCIVEPISMQQLVDQGYLVPLRIYTHPVDLKGVHKQAGDYKPDELAPRVSKLVGNVVHEWQSKAKGRRTIAFAVNRAHSRAIVDEFLKAGIAAEHLDGETPDEERRAALARLESGKTLVISNASLFGEGVDIPEVSCVITAKPTLSRASWIQWCGRGMRPFPGKADCVVLDLGGCALEHGSPLEEIEVSLSDRIKRPRPQPIRRCPQCFMVVLTSTCPGCGYQHVPQPVVPKSKEGELAALEAAAKRPLSTWEQQQAARLVRHLTTCISKGHKENYAKILYKNDHGFWPSKRIIEAARGAVQAGVGIRDPGRDPSMVSLSP